jgi:hypothetical protein
MLVAVSYHDSVIREYHVENIGCCGREATKQESID